jgi:uncharacterized SAM-binding protein YcdF (DUF218 family)
MFIAAQLLSFACQPLYWVVFLLAFGLIIIQRRPVAGRRLCWASLIVLLLIGWQRPVNAVMHQLETRTPAIDPYASLAAYAGVIVLGGVVERSVMWKPKGRVALTSGAERMTVPVGLMQLNPKLRLLYTGGVGRLAGEEMTEAERAKIYFDLMGVDNSRVIYEARSNTTFDNAVMSAELPGIDKTQPWLLLTTAAHMPRSLAVFQKVGWNVTPYPVDFRTPQTPSEEFEYSLTGGAEKWYYALHEIVGYWAYKLAGRI